MKIRAGFVSNSSTCSFQIYGIVEDVSEITELLQQKDIMPKDIEDDYDWYMESEGQKFFADKGLDVGLVYECEYVTIGKSWDQIGDDETGKQFKDSILAAIVEIFGEEMKKKCDTHSGEYQC